MKDMVNQKIKNGDKIWLKLLLIKTILL
jgi:hypothetical protein